MMKNFIVEEKVKIKINNFEMDAYRIYLDRADLSYLYLHVLKNRLLSSINLVFDLDYVYVNSEFISEFLEDMKDINILVYTEKEHNAFLKLSNQQ